MLLKYFKWGLLWSLFILIICLLPSNNIPEFTFFEYIYFDKIIHIFLYMILFILVIMGAKKVFKIPFLIAFIYCSLFGIMIELLQHYLIIDRDGQINDIYANFGGVIIGVILVNSFASVE